MPKKQRTAIVTGGGQGIGKCMVKRFLEVGMNVVIAEIDTSRGTETLSQFESLGSVKFVQCDVARPDSVQTMVQGAVDEFGQFRLLTMQPPLYPFVLAGLGFFSPDLVFVARALNAFLFAVLLVLVGWFLWRQTGYGWLACLVCALVLVTPFLVAVFSAVSTSSS